MSLRPSTDLGSHVVASIGGAPHTAAATVNGSAIDRMGKDSCVLVGVTGAATGGPASKTFDSKLQQSDDGSTGWTDISGAAITQITADSTLKSVSVNLRGCKRYIRAVDVTVPAASVVILGGAESLPAA
jgi:hypothetical protein